MLDASTATSGRKSPATYALRQACKRIKDSEKAARKGIFQLSMRVKAAGGQFGPETFLKGLVLPPGDICQCSGVPFVHTHTHTCTHTHTYTPKHPHSPHVMSNRGKMESFGGTLSRTGSTRGPC